MEIKQNRSIKIWKHFVAILSGSSFFFNQSTSGLIISSFWKILIRHVEIMARFCISKLSLTTWMVFNTNDLSVILCNNYVHLECLHDAKGLMVTMIDHLQIIYTQLYIDFCGSIYTYPLLSVFSVCVFCKEDAFCCLNLLSPSFELEIFLFLTADMFSDVILLWWEIYISIKW